MPSPIPPFDSTTFAVRELEVAVRAAAAGGAVVRAGYGKAIVARTKKDRSPVTEVDEAAERAIRTMLAETFPEDGILGEEFGRGDGPSGRLWVIDPLDGTRNFLIRLPFVSTQVALFENGQFTIGASAAPCFEEIVWAAKGHGAWRNGDSLRVSTTGVLDSASLSLGNVKTLARGKRWHCLGSLIARAARCRGYGDFFHYHALAAGQVDVVIESDVSIYDVAALAVIVEEAGGKVTDLEGQPLTLDSTTILATNGILHDAVVEALRG